ncbi:phosphopyruvate hydratase [Candidatus Berkelbacteria bacterium]|nr:phosphopyruvate hydratase [Candidatus Berkelbacteria bacterium]
MDSRGVPTLEVTLVLNDGTQEIASVPSGTSTGVHEALELRDGDTNRHEGKGVLKAVAKVNGVIAPKIIGMEVSEQKKIDSALIALDGSPQKQTLGANSLLGVSIAAVKAAATSGGFELFEYLNLLAGRMPMGLPVPLVNLFEGGKHATGGPQFQEFHVIPVGFNQFSERFTAGQKVAEALNVLAEEKQLSTGYGLEGGIVPRLTDAGDILSVLAQAVKQAGYSEKEIMFGIDVAASSFYDDNRYELDGRQLTTDKLIEYLKELFDRFPMMLVEDPLAEDDWFGWHKVTEILGSYMVVGDDLFVSSKERLMKGITENVANAIIIKPNQVGTVTETLETVAAAHEHGYKLVCSHRSGETRDSFLADLSVAVGAWGIKTGAFNQAEHMSKYERLLAIEKKIKR